MKLTNEQLKKLTPAQRKARAKAIAYKRAYHARKRKLNEAKAKGVQMIRAIKIHHRKTQNVNSIDRLEVLIRELRDTRSKTQSLIQEIRSIKL